MEGSPKWQLPKFDIEITIFFCLFLLAFLIS